jgi:hypothetical protein
MSTRCEIAIANEDGKVKAKLYRHSDGYPESVLRDLQCDVPAAYQAITKADRHCDPEMLAAMLVVQSVHRGLPTLQPCQNTHEDLEYKYLVTIHDDECVEVEETKSDEYHHILIPFE